MNIDFHYGVIYVVARLGGLSTEDAQTVAHACQYIDDSTTAGLLVFSGGETFERFATAHKLFDYVNVHNNTNRIVWTPFHFLPAAVGENLEERAICRPDSAVAREMVRCALQRKGFDNALHRLGTTLHTYVDTWAHQNFSGMISDFNRVHHLEAEDCTPENWKEHLAEASAHLVASAESDFISGFFPLGHGAALHYPDQPWAEWTYVNGKGTTFVRKNLPDFVDAANMACRVVQAYCAGVDDFASQAGLTEDAKNALHQLLSSNRSTDEQERLLGIDKAVRTGVVPGLNEALPQYIAKGAGSWKDKATGIVEDGDGDVPPRWSEAFERSDYRKYHDAVKEHRFIVTQEILPKYGLRLV